VRPFEWNALKIGDHVLVHVDADELYPLREATVAIVDAQRVAHDVGVRLLVEKLPEGDITWPRRLHVHMSSHTPPEGCWRCRANADALAVVN
jgi:hypothetical protein